MADNAFSELQKCLEQASRLCSRLSSDETHTQTSGISSIATAANRARNMMSTSSSNGLYRRLQSRERLRSTTTPSSSSLSESGKAKNKKPKEKEIKPFEFALVNFEEEDFPLTITDESLLLRGFIQLPSDASEKVVRSEIAKAIQVQYPLVTPDDIEFLKANRKRLMKPVNSSEYNYKKVKLLAGQGSIYIKVKDGFECLLTKEDQKEASDHKVDKKKMKMDEEDPFEAILMKSVFATSSTATETSTTNLSTTAGTTSSVSTRQLSSDMPLPGREDFTKVVNDLISYCQDNNIENPGEILRVAQQRIVTGRPLEQAATFEDSDTETNFLMINRQQVFASAKEELADVSDDSLRLTVEISFYGEIAQDSGGPRKEFFRLALREINDKFFKDGLKDHLEEDYYLVGVLIALSILQNGPIPRFIPENILEQLGLTEVPSHPCVVKLKEGLDKLGLIQLIGSRPTFLHLLHPSTATMLTRKVLLNLLTPSFSEDGTNARNFEQAAYASFMRYVREAAAGQRMGGTISLEDILEFTTCSSEEPALGFEPHPKIEFRAAGSSVKWAFLPTSQTCPNILYLPVASISTKQPAETDQPVVSIMINQPPDADLFEVYDHAFGSKYFGKC